MSTDHLILIGVGVAVVLMVAWFLLRRPAQPKRPYAKRPSLLTASEMRFYRALLPAVPHRMIVFVKVRLLDVVAVAEADWREHGAPASGMHLDFVVAEAGTLAPVLVIELNDKSHQRPEVQKRDALKTAALAAAGVRLLRVQVGRYDGLRALVKGAVG